MWCRSGETWERGVVASRVQPADGDTARVTVRLLPSDLIDGASGAGPASAAEGGSSRPDGDGSGRDGGADATTSGEAPDLGGTLLEFECKVNEGGVESNDIKPCNTYGLGGAAAVEDLTMLTHLHEPAVLSVLRSRFSSGSIYTYTGPILLAVNPFKPLPQLYTREVLLDYYGAGLLRSVHGRGGQDEQPELPPHVYARADAAYRAMMGGGETASASGGAGGEGSEAGVSRNQSLLVSGESGAGKTETTKIILTYMATVGRSDRQRLRPRRPRITSPGRRSSLSSPTSPRRQVEVAGPGQSSGAVVQGSLARDLESLGGIERRILQSNPILEAFGNAKTLRNDNSSRFGKFIELFFTKKGILVAARIQTYLLEKVRLVYQAKGERNFHILFQLCAGLEAAERTTLSVESASQFRYLNETDCIELHGVDDGADFRKTCEAMSVMGFTDFEVSGVKQVLAALLHLGNVEFEAPSEGGGSVVTGVTETGGAGGSDEATASALSTASRLIFGDDGWRDRVDGLAKVMTTTEVRIGRETVHRENEPGKAADARDALVRSVYGAIFDWIVVRLNKSVSEAAEREMFIGVLDTFGFEAFETNSFEQLCINYCNEKLQQHFNSFVFKQQQAEYKREDIVFDDIEFQDNQDVLSLIESKPGVAGILRLLDDACRFPKADDQKFLRDLAKQHADHPRMEATARQVPRGQFAIHHYAGPVSYSVTGFLDKNKDAVAPEAIALLKESSLLIVQEALGQQFAQPPESASRSRKSSSTMLRSVGSHFQAQLRSLMTAIESTTPHYIRCIKPNVACVRDAFEPPFVTAQLRYQGVLEAVRVARLGYSVRVLHPLFLERYWVLTARKEGAVAVFVNQADDDAIRTRCDELLSALEFPERSYQLGLTKVFLRTEAHEVLEHQRASVLRKHVVLIQASVRRWRWRRWWLRLRDAAVVVQSGVRGMWGRAIAREARAQLASLIIQARAKSWFHRWRFVVLRRGILLLQARRRGAEARRSVVQLRRHRGATKMQALFRGTRVCRSYRKRRLAAVTLQCAERRRVALHKAARLRKAARDVVAMREENISLRNQVRELHDRLRQLQLKHSAVKGALNGARADGLKLGENADRGVTPPSGAVQAAGATKEVASAAGHHASEAATAPTLPSVRVTSGEVGASKPSPGAAASRTPVSDAGDSRASSPDTKAPNAVSSGDTGPTESSTGSETSGAVSLEETDARLDVSVDEGIAHIPATDGETSIPHASPTSGVGESPPQTTRVSGTVAVHSKMAATGDPVARRRSSDGSDASESAAAAGLVSKEGAQLVPKRESSQVSRVDWPAFSDSESSGSESSDSQAPLTQASKTPGAGRHRASDAAVTPTFYHVNDGSEGEVSTSSSPKTRARRSTVLGLEGYQSRKLRHGPRARNGGARRRGHRARASLPPSRNAQADEPLPQKPPASSFVSPIEMDRAEHDHGGASAVLGDTALTTPPKPASGKLVRRTSVLQKASLLLSSIKLGSMASPLTGVTTAEEKAEHGRVDGGDVVQSPAPLGFIGRLSRRRGSSEVSAGSISSTLGVPASGGAPSADHPPGDGVGLDGSAHMLGEENFVAFNPMLARSKSSEDGRGARHNSPRIDAWAAKLSVELSVAREQLAKAQGELKAARAAHAMEKRDLHRAVEVERAAREQLARELEETRDMALEQREAIASLQQQLQLRDAALAAAQEGLQEQRDARAELAERSMALAVRLEETMAEERSLRFENRQLRQELAELSVSNADATTAW